VSKRAAQRGEDTKAFGQGARWLLLLPSLPGQSSNGRVRVWRRLQSIGALLFKSVWVLPAREDCIEAFQWVVREIEAQGGQASLCEGRFFDPATDDEIHHRLGETRNEEYAAIAEEARALAKELRGRKPTADRRKRIDAAIEKLQKRLAEVVAIDWCAATGREPAEGLVAQLSSLASAHRTNGESAALEHQPKPRGATWVTRTGVHVDRIASAWLIRRFIDPEATLKFVAPTGYVPQKGELRFDMFAAEHTHVGDRCTFEVLLERFAVADAGLRAIAEIVHDIDLKDSKFGREETPGIRTLVAAICTAHREDEARIEAGSAVLDSLHTLFVQRAREKSVGKKRGSPA
jgi:hypothetical protein